jgi:hypothetical protein
VLFYFISLTRFKSNLAFAKGAVGQE